MSLSNGVNVVRQGSPEFSEGLTTNGIILLYVSSRIGRGTNALVGVVDVNDASAHPISLCYCALQARRELAELGDFS